jgi:hypothetical protein
MLTRSTINPKSIWVRRIDKSSSGLTATLRVRWNVHTVEISDMNDDPRTEYEYDEEEITYTLPMDVDSSEKLASWIKTNKTKLVNQAKVNQQVISFEKPVVQEPWYVNIENVRDKIV